MRLTVADAQNSRIPIALGICPTDDRFYAYLNEGIQRLLIKGKWWGTYQKFRICATDGCITLPPQIATIETAAVCGVPIPVHDLWFEFLENGSGLRSNNTGSCSSGSSTSMGYYNGNCFQEANYRGRFCTFGDIVGLNKKLNWICDLASDIGKSAIFFGYDNNGNWIRTLQGGVYADGEVIVASQGTGTLSTNIFSSITDVQLPSNMDGQTWLYTYNASDATKILIGHYQYFETRPSYARYQFPGILQRNCSDDSNCCPYTTVEIIAKLEFIPVKKPTDYIIISNLPALKMMCVAIKKYEDSVSPTDVSEAAGFEAMAIKLLNDELDHYLGSGRSLGINLIGSSLGSVEPVPTLV